jgi:site-specific recombinase XerD
MNRLPSILQGFFTDRLARQRQASPHTITAYRDTVRLLVQFAARTTGKQPVDLDLPDLNATLIAEFLTHLETTRGNSVSTRNARLAAIRSLFRYAAVHAPEHAAVIERVLAIPPKRGERAIVDYLTTTEADALLAAPDRTTWLGRRDHALLTLAVQTGLRVSELTGLCIQDLHLPPGPHVRCHGKGRKDRITPLTRTTLAVLRTWLAERGGNPADLLFPTRRGSQLSPDAVQGLVAKHTATAAASCPSLTARKITPHTLRHTTAMALLHAGVDTSVIALWLGHEQTDTTLIYLHADLTLKQQALDRVHPPHTKPGRYQPADAVLAFLDSL